MIEIFTPDHVHFLATATLGKTSLTTDRIRGWLSRLVKAVGMEVLAGPFVVECSDPGNEGVTGIVVLSTSHCSLHIWDQCTVPYLKMDLYSCRRFSTETVMDMLRELDARVVEYLIIDRNHQDEADLVSGHMVQTEKGSIDFR